MSDPGIDAVDLSVRLGVRSGPVPRRVLAGVIDLVPLALVAALVWFVSGLLVSDLVAALIAASAVAVVLLVQLVVEGIRGRTIGKTLLGLRLVGVETLAAPGTGNVMLRAAVVWVPGTLVPLLGAVPFFVSVRTDPRSSGRGWHDRAAGSWLVDTLDGLDPFDREALRAARREQNRPTERAHLVLPSLATGAAPFDPRLTNVVRSTAGVMSLVVTEPGWTAGRPDPEDTRTRTMPATRSDVDAVPEPKTWAFVLDDGTRYPLAPRSLVGRAPAATEAADARALIALVDPAMKMSRNHLEVVLDDDGYAWVTDLGSANGTTVITPDGERTEMQQHTPHRIEPGHRVQIGARVLRFEKVVGP